MPAEVSERSGRACRETGERVGFLRRHIFLRPGADIRPGRIADALDHGLSFSFVFGGGKTTKLSNDTVPPDQTIPSEATVMSRRYEVL